MADWHLIFMKRTLYIFLFAVFGIIFQFFLHAILEIIYIKALISNFSVYGFGLSWEEWFYIHHVATIIFFLGGLIFGICGGIFFWRKIYQKN